MSLYLKASSQIQVLNEYDGKPGLYVKTFALNDKRNKNGWRVTWDSIKKNIADFIDNPGILYKKCEGSVCDLDHTEASTYEASLRVQEDYRVTNIIDYALDEATHTAYFIHQVTDDDFAKMVNNDEIKYVSPSIWPVPGAYDILGKNEKGLPLLDCYDWKALHDAFVNDPAFGDDAKITATCEGQNCQMRLLSAKDIVEEKRKKKKKQLTADDLAPLEQPPLLVKHKEHLAFVSVTKKMYDEVNAVIAQNGSLDAKSFLEISKNNSLNACACDASRSMTEEKQVQEKIDAALSAAKKASEEEMDKKDAKIKELESKIEELSTPKAKKGSKAKDACAKCGSEDHTTKEHTKENSADPDDDDDDDEMKAKVATLEARLAAPLVEKMLSARKSQGATEDQLKALATSLSAKGFTEIEEIYNNEKIFIESLSAKENSEERIHLPFNGGNEALSAKSLEEVFQEATA